MPCINDYSTLNCLKKKHFFCKKNYPLYFHNFFNNQKYYKIIEKLSYPHFPQFFYKHTIFSFQHTVEIVDKKKIVEK
jgi:hypothetical protein